MNWLCELTEDGEEGVRKLPKPIQKRVARILTEMEIDAFRGNVRPLQSATWKDVFRRRIDDYRILFVVSHQRKDRFPPACSTTVG
jgi:mRNA-degrading endonuclease RelE of RelBE toxin-antitoxin system